MALPAQVDAKCVPWLADLPHELLLPEEKAPILLGLSLTVSVSRQLCAALLTLTHTPLVVGLVLVVALPPAPISLAALAKPLLHPLTLLHQLCPERLGGKCTISDTILYLEVAW